MASSSRLASLSLCVLTVLFPLVPLEAADKDLPRQVPPVFARGETLTYTATLNELPAGNSQIRLSRTRHGKREVYRATAQGRTSELIEYLYRLHGTADGLFTANGFTPLAFRFAYSDHKRTREIAVRYDPTTNTLLGTTRKKAPAQERRLPAGEVYDPLTAFYVLRSNTLAPGKIVHVQVFTGHERYRVVCHVIGRENVLLAHSIRPAIRLQPAIFSLDTAPEKNLLPPETSLWVTVDPAHIPLKFESFLPFGRLVVELTGTAAPGER
ncbi:MAG: DUF3108 domain-containing protein [Candidatus Binatia bacterium]|nr:DUF3108 domain-containing protein [Candidatus Binatia bacterium]